MSVAIIQPVCTLHARWPLSCHGKLGRHYQAVGRGAQRGHAPRWPPGDVSTAALASTGALAFIASRDGDSRLWSMREGSVRCSLNERAVTWAEFSADDKKLVSVHSDGSVRVWDTASCDLVAKLENRGAVSTASFITDGCGSFAL